jgi:hypothetical protein
MMADKMGRETTRFANSVACWAGLVPPDRKRARVLLLEA